VLLFTGLLPFGLELLGGIVFLIVVVWEEFVFLLVVTFLATLLPPPKSSVLAELPDTLLLDEKCGACGFEGDGCFIRFVIKFWWKTLGACSNSISEV